MPLLEEYEPSWIQDGWQIQGEQNETRFDDDIPWDITAWTRDHPDQSDFNCCAAVCPSDSDSLNVVLDGIVNHGCFSTGFSSFIVNGDPNTSYTLPNVGAGYWQVEIMGVFTRESFGSLDCSGPFGSDDMNLFIQVLCGSGSISINAFLQVGVSTFCFVFQASSSNVGQRIFNNDFPLDGIFDFGTATIS